MDLLDKNYTLDLYRTNQAGTYYFDFKKEVTSGFDFNDDVYSYGCQDLDSMNKEVREVFEILKESKERLNSMGYDIGFKPEFSFSETTLIHIDCSMAHNSIKYEDYED